MHDCFGIEYTCMLTINVSTLYILQIGTRRMEAAAPTKPSGVYECAQSRRGFGCNNDTRFVLLCFVLFCSVLFCSVLFGDDRFVFVEVFLPLNKQPYGLIAVLSYLLFNNVCTHTSPGSHSLPRYRFYFRVAGMIPGWTYRFESLEAITKENQKAPSLIDVFKVFRIQKNGLCIRFICL